MSDLRHSSVMLKCVNCRRESHDFVPVLASHSQDVALCRSCLQPMYQKRYVDVMSFKHPDVLRIFDEVSL